MVPSLFSNSGSQHYYYHYYLVGGFRKEDGLVQFLDAHKGFLQHHFVRPVLKNIALWNWYICNQAESNRPVDCRLVDLSAGIVVLILLWCQAMVDLDRSMPRDWLYPESYKLRYEAILELDQPCPATDNGNSIKKYPKGSISGKAEEQCVARII